MFKRWQICLLITALVSWEITIVLAISVAWIVPFYYKPPGPGAENLTAKIDTQMYAMILGACVNPGILQLKPDKVIIRAEEKKQKGSWTAISSVVYPKYADDESNTYIEFGTEALVLSQFYSMTGSILFENELIACKADTPPDVCNKMFTLRGECTHWSIDCGRPAIPIIKYFLHKKWPLVIIKHARRFLETGSTHVFTFIEGRQEIHAVFWIGWKRHVIMQRYGVRGVGDYYVHNSTRCIKNPKTFVSTRGITSVPVVAYCYEIIGFELHNDDTHIFDTDIDDIKSWVTNCTNTAYSRRHRAFGALGDSISTEKSGCVYKDYNDCKLHLAPSI